MSAVDPSRFQSLLQPRRALIADHWYAAIARTSFTPRPAAEVRVELTALTEQVISVLLQEPFDPAPAGAVGSALARLHYVQPAALSGTLDVLGQQIATGLAPKQLSALHPRLMALLGALAAGFFAESRAIILDEQDQIRRALFVTRQQAEAAEQARLAAEAAVHVRSDVMSAAAHDLRAPLTSILGQADLMRLRLGRDEPPSAEWLRARVDAVRAGAARMRGMVEELLDVSRLQLGQTLELQLEPLDVGALVGDVARPWEAAAESGGTPVLLTAPPGLIVEGDRARLERVVENLLGNAIKYSSAATPVYMELRPHAEGAVLSVRDQGVGIPADELPHLFTPFYRASTARGLPGIGIGLAGAKTIVEQHGGRITIESAVDRGTTVAITLPTVPPPAGEMAQPAS